MRGDADLQEAGMVFTTNDVPGCPKGGLLSGTDKRGLGAADFIPGGSGSDVTYGGSGDDIMWAEEGDDVIYGGDGDDADLTGGKGEDILYGGDGNGAIDAILGDWQQRGKLYCGEGIDAYLAGKGDYVSSSCEEKMWMGPVVP